MGEILRKLRVEAEMFPCDGVDEAQCLCVETLTVELGDAVVGAVHRVPCHRVVGSTGRLTGYAYGVEMKQYLLELEQQE